MTKNTPNPPPSEASPGRDDRPTAGRRSPAQRALRAARFGVSRAPRESRPRLKSQVRRGRFHVVPASATLHSSLCTHHSSLCHSPFATRHSPPDAIPGRHPSNSHPFPKKSPDSRGLLFPTARSRTAREPREPEFPTFSRRFPRSPAKSSNCSKASPLHVAIRFSPFDIRGARPAQRVSHSTEASHAQTTLSIETGRVSIRNSSLSPDPVGRTTPDSLCLCQRPVFDRDRSAVLQGAIP